MNRTRRTVDERLMVRAGDLLVSWSATLDAFVWAGEDAWLNQHIFKVVPHQEIVDRRYMLFLLKNEIENLKKTEHLHGSTMMHINRGPFLAHLVPLPSLQAQAGVAQKIEELFAEVDDGESALARARSDLETWRKALLKAAVTGDLTADRRARWQAEPRNKGKKYVEATGPDTTRLPDLPLGWVWASLGQLSWASGYGTSEKCETDAKGTPVLRIPNIKNGAVTLDDLKRTVERISIENVALAPGDLLIIRTNGSEDLIGRAAIVLEEFAEPTYFASYLIRLRLVGETQFHRWIGILVDSPIFRADVLRSIGSSAGQYNLNLTKIEDFALPIPPLMEIDAAIRAFHKAAEGARAGLGNVSGLRDASSTLRQSILAAAFRGDLA